MTESQAGFATRNWTRLGGSFLVFSLILLLPAVALIAYEGKSIVRSEVDTDSYRVNSISARSLLEGIRTPVYPLVLRAATSFGDERAVIIIQFGVYICFLSCMFLYLRTLGAPRWTLFVLPVPFAMSSVVVGYTFVLLPELIAAAAAFSVLLLSLSAYFIRHRPKIDWLVGGLLTVSVLSKPQYLFLIPYLLLVGLIQFGLQGNEQEKHWRRYRELRVCVRYFSPVLGYCLLRLVVVGHFGLVSFGGSNLAGLLLNPIWFTESFAESLPAGGDRDAAKVIINRRLALLERASADPDLKTEDPRIRVKDALDATVLGKMSKYDAICISYNANMWDVARPALFELYGNAKGEEQANRNVMVDATLGRLSMLVLKENWLAYLHWLFLATTEALNRVVRYDSWNARLLTSLCGMWCIAVAGYCLARWWLSEAYRGRRKLVLSFGVVGCMLLFPGKVLGWILGVWGWIPGTVAPLFIPISVVIVGVLLSGLVILSGVRGNAPFVELSFVEYSVCCCSLFCCCGLALIVSVELPLDRYLMTVSPAATVASALVIVSSSLRFACSFVQLLSRSSDSLMESFNG